MARRKRVKEFNAKAELNRLIVNKTGKVISQLIQEEFLRQEDPNEQPWKPLKKDGSEFDKKFGLRRAFRKVISGNKILIYNKLPYAIFYQKGTKYIPARKMLPEGELPPWWHFTLEESLTRTINWTIRRAIRNIIN